MEVGTAKKAAEVKDKYLSGKNEKSFLNPETAVTSNKSAMADL